MSAVFSSHVRALGTPSLLDGRAIDRRSVLAISVSSSTTGRRFAFTVRRDAITDAAAGRGAVLVRDGRDDEPR